MTDPTTTMKHAEALAIIAMNLNALNEIRDAVHDVTDEGNRDMKELVISFINDQLNRLVNCETKLLSDE